MQISYLTFLILGIFWHIGIQVKIRILETHKLKISMYFKGYCTETYVLNNLDIGTSMQKIDSLSCTVLPQRSAKQFTHNSALEFCNDLWKLACFGTFGSKRACIIMKMLNHKFDTCCWINLRCISQLLLEKVVAVFWLKFTIYKGLCHNISLSLSYIEKKRNLTWTMRSQIPHSTWKRGVWQRTI